jgi:16S rRNA (cytidine1402-2'-O)-methyltransferase
MVAIFGSRRAALARELTKIHEEFLCGTLPEILEVLRSRPEIRGEITLVIEKGEVAPQPPDHPESVREHLEAVIGESGLARNEALKAVARERGISRKDAYRLLQDELDAV